MTIHAVEDIVALVPATGGSLAEKALRAGKRGFSGDLAGVDRFFGAGLGLGLGEAGGAGDFARVRCDSGGDLEGDFTGDLRAFAGDLEGTAILCHAASETRKRSHSALWQARSYALAGSDPAPNQATLPRFTALPRDLPAAPASPTLARLFATS